MKELRRRHCLIGINVRIVCRSLPPMMRFTVSASEKTDARQEELGFRDVPIPVVERNSCIANETFVFF